MKKISIYPFLPVCAVFCSLLAPLSETAHANPCPPEACGKLLEIGKSCYSNNLTPDCTDGAVQSGSCVLDSVEYKLYSCTKGRQSLEVVDLPSQSNVYDDKLFLQFFSSHLDDIIAYVRKSTSRYSVPRIPAVTVAEAKDYFTSYLKEKTTPEEMEKILTPQFFGVLNVAKLMTSEEVFKADPYVGSAISNALTLKVPNDEAREWRKKSFEEERKRFRPATLLLDYEAILPSFIKTARGWLPRELENFESRKSYQAAIDEFISPKYFGVPKDHSERKEFYLKNDVGFLDHKLIRGIYQGAKLILDQTKSGDTLVIFGNSPYFVGRALRFLVSDNPQFSNYRKIIDFPFSGAPNGVRQIPDLRNVVTSDRLAYMQERLRILGLSSKNPELIKHDTYFIDVIGLGAGFAFVAEEILRDFKSANLPNPSLKVIAMNKINIHLAQEGGRNHMIAKENPDSDGHTTLYFPSIQNTHFKTECLEAYIPGHALLDQLPSDDFRGFPEYNPSYWRKEYEDLLNQGYSDAMKIILEYFDENIRNLIQG